MSAPHAVSDPTLSAFDALVASEPDRPLVATPNRRATAGALARQAEELARHLLDHSLVPGQLVGLVAPNGPGFLVGHLALRRLGLVPVHCDVTTPPAALEETLSRLEVAGCLSLAEAWPGGSGDWKLTTRLGEAAPRLSADLGAVKLSSGSTGTPRGIAVSGAELAADERQLAGAMGFVESGRHLAAIPFSHSYGFTTLVLPALVRGVCLVMADERGPLAPLAAGRVLGATFFPSVPAFLSALVRLAEPGPWPETVRLVISAGAPLPPETARLFRERFGQPVHVFYGASECGGITFDRRGDAAERGSVGTPLEGVRLAIDEESGRVAVFSAAVAEGYFPEASPELGDGRFLTGDLGRFDGAELRLLGRADDLVLVKGKNVNPREVEAVIAQLPGVAEVCVLGIAAADGLERTLRAVVVPRGEAPLAVDREEVVAHCRAHLAEHKVPRSVVMVDALPRTERGKLDRQALTALASAGGPS
jgi:long-chain acyl-CoA synthetase